MQLMIRNIPPAPGEPAHDFVARATNNNNFHFDTVAGRYLILCFFGSAGMEKCRRVLEHALTRHRDFFDDNQACFFGVSVDPNDEKSGRVQQVIPGYRHFWDLDQKVSILYGAVEYDKENGANSPSQVLYHPFTLVLDPFMRVIANIPLSSAEEHNNELDRIIESLPEKSDYAGVPLYAPVLMLPRVLEPELCRELIRQYNAHGGDESGFMREKDGKTVGVYDNSFKRRRDYHIEDKPTLDILRNRISRRIVPEIFKAFRFKVTQAERYMVGCYDGDGGGGYFRAHRDNTTKGTAHRRFAVTINLNAEEYEGGDLRFGEFGERTYRAPTGGAVVFSCSLLHEATPVTRGKRYAFLPFLYDNEAAKIRDTNLGFLSGENINLNEV